MEPREIEAVPALNPWDPKGLVANVLVYDNHVESARQLQVGPRKHVYTQHASILGHEFTCK